MFTKKIIFLFCAYCANVKHSHELCAYLKIRENINHMKQTLRTAKEFYKFCKQNRRNQILALQSGKISNIVKELFSEIFEDVLRDDFKKYQNHTFRTIVFGIQLYQQLKRYLFCNCNERAIGYLLAEEFGKCTQTKIVSCQFWNTLNILKVLKHCTLSKRCI